MHHDDVTDIVFDGITRRQESIILGCIVFRKHPVGADAAAMDKDRNKDTA